MIVSEFVVACSDLIWSVGFGETSFVVVVAVGMVSGWSRAVGAWSAVGTGSGGFGRGWGGADWTGGWRYPGGRTARMSGGMRGEIAAGDRTESCRYLTSWKEEKIFLENYDNQTEAEKLSRIFTT